MVDRSDKGSDCDEISSKTTERVSGDGTLNQAAKTCADCGTTKTPLWRGGPAGPKSLCNACGIRSRKRRRALLGLSNKEEKKPKKNNNSNTSTVTSDGSSSNNSEEEGNNKTGDSGKKKIMGLGSEVVLQRPRSTMFKPRRKLGEEEQAAMLLMALSCGSVFA
ncbi:GATA transcription factor 15-like [Apium graveolens]|uniref:GATA transcription factor 15-like n=1 Tax=Apium graveolens TaxID=4045 RepID=UPI003D7A8F4E